MSDKEVELIFFACQRRGRPCKQAGDIELIREVPVRTPSDNSVCRVSSELMVSVNLED